MFAHPLGLTQGEVVQRGGFVYADFVLQQMEGAPAASPEVIQIT
jgi:hypothetical protein